MVFQVGFITAEIIFRLYLILAENKKKNLTRLLLPGLVRSREFYKSYWLRALTTVGDARRQEKCKMTITLKINNRNEQ